MRLAIASLMAFLALPALAAEVTQATLQNYAKKSLPMCPDSTLKMTPIGGRSLPANFVAFEVTVTGKDASCSSRKHLLYSPSSGQVVIGSVIPLPPDARALPARLTDYSSQVMKREMTATVMPFPLPDGLKYVTMTKQTEYGPFAYHGYVDASEQFLILGMRGDIKDDPGKTLLDTIGMTNAVRRGNPKAKIEIVELSDFECPACGMAHKTIWPVIEKNLSRINFIRLDLPLFEHHTWAMPAALGARAIQKVAPNKYWEYVDYMFGNQEAIGKQPFDQVLKNFVEDHDIDWAKVEKIYHSQTEQQALIQQVERAFDNNVNGTPTFVLNGQMLAYGPEGSFAVEAIKNALGIKSTAPAKKQASKK